MLSLWDALSPALVVALMLQSFTAAAVPLGEPSAPVTSGARERVIVLCPSEVDDTMKAVLARVRGELAAARFQVSVAPLDLTVDPAKQVEAAVLQTQALAALAIEGSPAALSIWVFDRVGRRTSVQRTARRRDDLARDAQVLALEAIELIRVSMANLWPAPAPAQPPVATPSVVAPPGGATPGAGAQLATTPVTTPLVPAPPLEAPPAEPSPVEAPPAGAAGPEFSVAVGIASLRDWGTPAAQWMGSLNLGLRGGGRFVVRGRVTGLGPRASVEEAVGSASLRRELLALGVDQVLLSTARWELFAGLAIGAQHVRAQGVTADLNRPTYAASAWCPMGLAGVGATVRLGPHVLMSARLDGVWAGSKVNLQFDETRTSPFSRPGVLGDVGIQAAFLSSKSASSFVRAGLAAAFGCAVGCRRKRCWSSTCPDASASGCPDAATHGAVARRLGGPVAF